MNDTPEQESLIPADIRAMSNDELIETHRKIEDHVKAQSTAFAEYLKPHKERQDWIEKQLFIKLAELNRGKTEGKRASISTEHGTAYLSTLRTPKVLDKEKYLDWCLEHYTSYGAMLQIGPPIKAELTRYQDENGGALPPHVEVSLWTRVNINKA